MDKNKYKKTKSITGKGKSIKSRSRGRILQVWITIMLKVSKAALILDYIAKITLDKHLKSKSFCITKLVLVITYLKPDQNLALNP